MLDPTPETELPPPVYNAVIARPQPLATLQVNKPRRGLSEAMAEILGAAKGHLVGVGIAPLGVITSP